MFTTAKKKKTKNSMYEVRDGSRILQFSGQLLGHSTSETDESLRWIEFSLYKTESGSYIISRVGVSIIYHGAACELVNKYNLSESTPDKLKEGAQPCGECQPSRAVPFVFPEKDRTWAYVTESPEDVLDALYKHNKNGTYYLTNVAKRLLEEASNKDDSLDMVYRLESIP
jgi:hypothetical protein